MESEDDDDEGERKTVFRELQRRTEYAIDRSPKGDAEGKKDVPVDASVDFDEDELQDEDESQLEKVEKENLIKGFKYGSTYVPCPDGHFPKLNTQKGTVINRHLRHEN